MGTAANFKTDHKTSLQPGRNKRAGMVLARRLSGRSPINVSTRNFSSPLMHARRLSPRSFTSISLRHFSSPLTHEVDDEVNGFDSFNKKFNSVDEEIHYDLTDVTAHQSSRIFERKLVQQTRVGSGRHEYSTCLFLF